MRKRYTLRFNHSFQALKKSSKFIFPKYWHTLIFVCQSFGVFLDFKFHSFNNIYNAIYSYYWWPPMNCHCKAECASLALCPVERDGQWDEGVFFFLVQTLNTGQTRGLSNTMTSDKMPAKFSL